MNSPTHDNLSVETSDSHLWFSGKLESNSNKSSYPVYAHQNVDSLDSQSLTTHLPSSTVSPSSLGKFVPISSNAMKPTNMVSTYLDYI
ncbi:unnamed protein product [Schistosoma curassoni]|nr:unnamed protein product [Schistosoma curassoni]